jgi:hypothetical protein
MRYVIALIAMLAIGSAWADSPQPSKDVKREGGRLYKSHTEINFEKDVVLGNITKPDVDYIESRRLIKMSRLIQLRGHWKEQIDRSINEL